MKWLKWFTAFFAVIGFEAWFLKPNNQWTFEWEPFLALIVAICAFIQLERRQLQTTSEADITLLKALHQPFENSGALSFYKNQDFGGSFLDSKLEPLENFVAYFHDFDHSFLHKTIELKKQKTLKDAKHLLNLLYKHTFLLDANNDARKIYPESIPEDVRKYQYEINNAATKFHDTYSDFIRTATLELRTRL